MKEIDSELLEEIISNYNLVWQKENLPASDAQEVKEGTNPTGNLKLTQSNWEQDGKVIDQTTYFRQNVFGHLVWQQIKDDPFIEMTIIPCLVLIKDIFYGIHHIRVRHKPSGESNQANYTTYLSWGEELLLNMSGKSLSGKTLSLYRHINNEKFLIRMN